MKTLKSFKLCLGLSDNSSTPPCESLKMTKLNLRIPKIVSHVTRNCLTIPKEKKKLLFSILTFVGGSSPATWSVAIFRMR